MDKFKPTQQYGINECGPFIKTGLTLKVDRRTKEHYFESLTNLLNVYLSNPQFFKKIELKINQKYNVTHLEVINGDNTDIITVVEIDKL